MRARENPRVKVQKLIMKEMVNLVIQMKLKTKQIPVQILMQMWTLVLMEMLMSMWKLIKMKMVISKMAIQPQTLRTLRVKKELQLKMATKRMNKKVKKRLIQRLRLKLISFNLMSLI